MYLALVFAFSIVILPEILHADAGDLDPTFGGDGKVQVLFSAGSAFAFAVAVQSDGKIVVAGSSPVNGSIDFSIVRLNPDGTLDPTFDSDGAVTTDFTANTDSVLDLLIQPDGKILVAGESWNPNAGSTCFFNPTCDFALARYHPDGSLDTTFDSDGKLTIDFAGGPDSVSAIVVQSNQKIVVSGTARTVNEDDFAVVRLNSDGSLDSTFGNNGKTVTDFAGGFDRGWGGVAIQPDGKIIVGGSTATANSNDFAAVRYNTNGTVDNSFSFDGKVVIDFSQMADNVQGIAIQQDGKVVLAGNAVGGAGTDFALARLNPDGSLDFSFSFDGLQTIDFGNNESATAIKLQPDGKIITVGQALIPPNYDFALARCNPDGELDLTFNSDGKVITSFHPNFDTAFAVDLQDDGKIVAAGYVFNGITNMFALARYLGDPPPACIFCDDFEDGQLASNWTYLKPSWNESGGSLIGTPSSRKAEAIATPAFAGCSQCSIQATMSTQGGVGNRLWLLGWYIDKKNTIEVLMNEGNDKWILKQRVGGSVVAKTKGLAAIIPNVFYNVQVTFDGSNFTLIVNGVSIATMPAFTAPNGTVGFRSRNTAGSFGLIAVN